jgi:hypothetical protein
MSQYKTVLAPNAPWPKLETVEKPKSKPKFEKVSIARENDSLASFLQNHEKPNHYKAASAHRTRDKLSGRFKSDRGLEK